MGLATPYLVLYNACCLAGWCFALVAGIKTVAAGDGALAARLGPAGPPCCPAVAAVSRRVQSTGPQHWSSMAPKRERVSKACRILRRADVT